MRKVLIGDDDKFIRYFLGKALEEEDVEVKVVESGSEVLRRVLKEKFALIFLDIHMNGMDGFQVIPLIREISPETKVVVITGDLSMETEKRVKNMGVVHYFTKPLNLEEIKKLVRKYTGQQRGRF